MTINLNSNGETLESQVKHELDLLLDEDLVAFIGIAFSKRPLLDDVAIHSTLVKVADEFLTDREKLTLAEQLVTLGKNVRQAVLDNPHPK